MLNNIINLISIGHGSLFLSYLRKQDGENLALLHPIVAKIVSNYKWLSLKPIIIPITCPHNIVILPDDRFAVTSINKVMIYSQNNILITSFDWTLIDQNRNNYNNSMAYCVLNNTLYIADNHNYCVKVFDLEGKNITSLYRDERRVGKVSDMVINKKNEIIITDQINDRIYFHSLNMHLIKVIDSNSYDNNQPFGMTLDKDDNIIVANFSNGNINFYDKDTNAITNAFNIGERTTISIGVDKRGNIIIPTPMADEIWIFTKEGEYVKIIGETGSEIGQLNMPNDIAVNSYGDIYVCDSGNNRVQIFYEE